MRSHYFKFGGSWIIANNLSRWWRVTCIAVSLQQITYVFFSSRVAIIRRPASINFLIVLLPHLINFFVLIEIKLLYLTWSIDSNKKCEKNSVNFWECKMYLLGILKFRNLWKSKWKNIFESSYKSIQACTEWQQGFHGSLSCKSKNYINKSFSQRKAGCVGA